MSYIIGINPTEVISDQGVTEGRGYKVGTRGVDIDGKEYVWVHASGAVTAAGYVVQLDESYEAAMVSTSTDAIGDLIGVATAAMADNDYGWVQVWGVCVVRVAASAGANVRLNSTATAGQLDDDGGSTAMAIDGLVLTTANGGAAATAAAVVNYPIIVSVGESQFTDGVTPGTAANNKALVLGASGEIATITSATITTLTTGAIAAVDSSLGITGLAAAQGGDVVNTGGTSSTTGNAGGVAKLVGGTPGATGVGGKAQVVGGPGGATSGDGGAAEVTGGAGTANNDDGGNVVISGGAPHGTGKEGIIALRSIVIKPQGAPTAKTTTAAISAAELMAGIITTTGATAPSEHQLPTGTLIDAELPGIATGDSFDFYVINTGTGASDDATLTVNTDVTIVGNPTVGAITDGTTTDGSGHFRMRRSGTNTYVCYRIA